MSRAKAEPKKVWCRHIKWKPYERRWWVFMDYVEADRGWKFCPVCGKHRPKKQRVTNIRVWEQNKP